MRRQFPFKWLLGGLVVLITISVVTAIAATNTVPSSRIAQQERSIIANDLKPSACASIYLSNIVTGSGTITGTTGNDLILGGAGSDTINGLGGNDCILGGGGDDTIDGGDGNDICIGKSGNNTFANCETSY
jgi:hypothetical protein